MTLFYFFTPILVSFCMWSGFSISLSASFWHFIWSCTILGVVKKKKFLTGSCDIRAGPMLPLGNHLVRTGVQPWPSGVFKQLILPRVQNSLTPDMYPREFSTNTHPNTQFLHWCQYLYGCSPSPYKISSDKHQCVQMTHCSSPPGNFGTSDQLPPCIVIWPLGSKVLFHHFWSFLASGRRDISELANGRHWWS